MIPLEETELKIVSCNLDNSQAHLFFLVDSLNADKLNITRFFKEVLHLESHSLYDFKKDEAFEDMLEFYGIIDVFDDQEISELMRDGLVDIKDLHRSIYDLLAVEQL